MRNVLWLIYYTVIWYLPNTYVPYIGHITKKIRGWYCGHLLFQKAGTDINICRHAYFGTNKISIGSHSGVGENFHAQQTDMIIGDNVMMASDILVIGGA